MYDLSAPTASTRLVMRRLMSGAVVSAALALGACSTPTAPFDFASLQEKPAPQSPASQSDVATGSVAQTDLQKATEYWGKQHAANPKDPQAAINYIRNLKALGAKQQAFSVAQQAYSGSPDNKLLASEYGRLALEQEQLSLAEKLLALADDPVKPDWKTISARGTVLAKQGKYREAIPQFERALALAPGNSGILNNLALAHAMDGHAERAEPMLRQAAADQTADAKVGRNLALVLGLQGKAEDAKSVMVKDLPADAAQDDAAYVKEMVGQQPAQMQPATASIRTSTIPAVNPKATAKPSGKIKGPAVAEDPSVMVQRLADGYANTPADAPVQLIPSR